jgi:hypothetical protein
MTKFKGNPEFPIEEPQNVAGGATTNDTDVIYCIDTGGADAVFSAGMQQLDVDGKKSTSAWAGKTYNGLLYGRWSNVGSDVQLACYRQIPINSQS